VLFEGCKRGCIKGFKKELGSFIQHCLVFWIYNQPKMFLNMNVFFKRKRCIVLGQIELADFVHVYLFILLYKAVKN
jgi:hypothetical protein